MSEQFNQARITGVIEKEFEYSNTIRDMDFYKTMVGVKRRSGTIDHIPIIVTNVLLPNVTQKSFKGEQVAIRGEFRGYNQLGKFGKYHLVMSLYVREIIFFGKGKWEDIVADENYIFLEGQICKNPNFRDKLTSGCSITESIISIKRNFYKTDAIPCIFWNDFALEAKNLKLGDRIQLRGRIQSREYFKRYYPDSEEGEVRTAYEVSCISFKKIEN